VAEFVEALSAFGDVGVIPLLDAANSMGARDLRILPQTGDASWGMPLTAEWGRVGSPVRAGFVLGANLAADADEDLRDALGNLELLVVSDIAMTDTARLADVVLPAASFAEKDGTFTNIERRIQRLTPTVPSPGMARADWEIFVDLSQYFDRPLDFTRPQEIWQDIGNAVERYAGITYGDIGLNGTRPEARALQPA
jgi:anaerobic selenocysteine-containing dehydrogenase